MRTHNANPAAREPTQSALCPTHNRFGCGTSQASGNIEMVEGKQISVQDLPFWYNGPRYRIRRETSIQPPHPYMPLEILSKPGGGKRLPRLLLIKPDRTCNEPLNGLCGHRESDGIYPPSQQGCFLTDSLLLNPVFCRNMHKLKWQS